MELMEFKKHNGLSNESLGDVLGVSAATVSYWVNKKRPVPVERCIEIDAITFGKVKCETLRPDVNWGAIRRKAKAVEA